MRSNSWKVTTTRVNIAREAALHFRDQFRAARAQALRDAEQFHAVIFALERLGRYLLGAQGDLGAYEKLISKLAGRSPFAELLPNKYPEVHVSFGDLYRIVRVGRNSALHEGAFARNLTTHAVELTLILEDALTSEMNTIGAFMVRGPICAHLWQPLSLVRQIFLANSFSFLPIETGDESPKWKLVSDLAVARFLRASSKGQMKRLDWTLQRAIEEGGLELVDPLVCEVNTPVADALTRCNGYPILVCSGARLLGIATPFDML